MTPSQAEVLLQNATPFLANHLWQSTLLALAAGALSLAFRRNQARVRFGLWLGTSLKFLIPFSLLAGIGSRLALPHSTEGVATGVYAVIEEAGRPFAQAPHAGGHAALPHLAEAVAALWLLGTAVVLGSWLARWLRVAALTRKARPVADGRVAEALRELGRGSGLRRPIPLRLCSGSMEPGIFGIVRPVLLWPEGFAAQLSDAQLRAILAHELEHVRRRDNLAAALHMLVEALFWFHPLVWWIGARLVEERERACDEAVLELGSRPEVYAESLLQACKFCVETPLSCVSGVAGSNLKRRVTRIMHAQTAIRLSAGRKLLLAALASSAFTGPILFGIFHAPQLIAQTTYTDSLPRQSFESATLKPSQSDDKLSRVDVQRGHFSETNVTVKKLIEFAYGIQDYQISGGPEWIDSDRYDLDATWKESAAAESPMPGGPPPPPPPPLAPPTPDGGPVVSMGPGLRPGQLQAMLITLLEERCHLKLTSASRELPVYALVVAEGGAHLTASSSTLAPPSFDGELIITARTRNEKDAHEVSLSNAPVSALAGMLSEQLNQQVVDKTGLKGPYDIVLHWSGGEGAADGLGAKLEEQLGLRLEPVRLAVKVFVVGELEKPADN